MRQLRNQRPPGAVTEPARVPCTRAYCRVSGVGQAEDGTSLDEQEEVARRYCTERGLPEPVVYVEVESGSEAAQEKRVELARLMAAVLPGDVVLVAKVDRWSRDIVWGVGSVRGLVRRGVRWISITEAIDAATTEGDNALAFMALIADMERKRIKERTVGARRRLRAMGFHVEGHAPLGFVVADRKLVIDPERAPVVRRIYELAIEGLSTREISATVATEHPGIPGMDHAAVARRLRDRRYLGESCDRGRRGNSKGGAPDGKWRVTHDPIVDRATWEAAQRALDVRRMGGRPLTGEARTASFMLRGMAHCASCGHVLRAQTSQDRIAHAGWYVCAHRCGVSARQDHADAEVERLVLARLDTLARTLAKPAKVTAPRKDPRDAERARLVRRLANLTEAIADGTITRETARTKLEEAETAIATIDASRAIPEPVVTPDDRAALLAQAEGIRRAWGGMLLEERREALGLLAGAIVIASTAERRWQRDAFQVTVTWKPLASGIAAG